MKVPFFDSNPGIVSELRSMDHSTKEYKKLLRKVFLEMGGMIYLSNYLKSSDEGNLLRKKYFRNLIITGLLLLSLFVWIILAMVLNGGKDTEQMTNADLVFVVGFIAIEAASIALAMIFAFRCRRILLEGVSFAIDNYSYDSVGADGGSLGSFTFQRAKVNKLYIVMAAVIFVAVFSFRAISNGTFAALSGSRAQDFSKAGLTITLTKDFHEQDSIKQTAAYASTKYAVMTLKEDFKTLEQYNIATDIPLKEYAQDVITNNSVDSTVEGNESRPYFVYTRQGNGKDLSYLAIVYRGSDAYWTVTFACETRNFKASREQFMKWADTVKVS